MTIFYPLDLIRTRLQSQDGTRRTQLRSVSSIVREEGIGGLYRGVGMAVAAHSIGWGIYLSLFRLAQDRARKLRGRDSTTGDFFSACFAAVTTSTIVTPMNLIKTRTQLHDDATRRHQTLLGGMTSVIRKDGVRSLFRGLGPQILLSGHTTIQVALYECIKRRVWGDHTSSDIPMTYVSVASALSKSVAVVVCNPLEVCRTRMQDHRHAHQMAALRGGKMSLGFATTFSLMRHIYSTEGLRGMYRGSLVNVLRVIPTTVVAFIAYEKCLQALRSVKQPTQNLH